LKVQRDRQKNGVSVPFIAAGALVVALAFAVAGFSLVIAQRHTSAVSTPKGVVEASAYDPNFSLLRVGSVAPNFQLRDSMGEVYSLKAERGHPVLLEYFAVWCPVCHRETPIMARVTKAYAPKNVTVWAILANPYGPDYEISGGRDLHVATHEDLAWYASTYKANYPLLIDPHFSTVNRYGAASYPTIYVVNVAGRITFAHSGALPYKNPAQQLDKVAAHA
jgi:peroxiredoxin